MYINRHKKSLKFEYNREILDRSFKLKIYKETLNYNTG